MNQPIIEVKDLSKKYRLGRIRRHDTLRDELSGLVKQGVNSLKGIGDGHLSSDEFWALKDINFSVYEGDVLGIIGKNGSGKSTLLKILSRIAAPSAGEIHIRGRVASLLEVGTGFSQELSGQENIFLNGAILGMTQAEIKKKFDEIVAFSEIEKFIDTPVKHYSSGMYMRLAFAIAAHLEPEILIVDEVLAVGDAEFQKKCLGKMAEVRKVGKTIIFVSHNMGAITQICNKTLWIDAGKIKFQGESQEAIRKYLLSGNRNESIFVQGHNSKKNMNLLKVKITSNEKENGNNILYNEEISVKIEYEVNKPEVNCTVWVSVQTVDGFVAFTTADFDMNRDILGRRKTGRYQSEVIIPSKWLNIGGYILVVGIVKNSPLIVYDRVEALNFNIVDNGTSPNSIFKEDTRRGIFQPFLQWKNEKSK